MIDLYYSDSGNSLRAIIALEECGLEYQPHEIDQAKGEHKTPEFLRMNPFGTVPVIIDHDGLEGVPITLDQSGAIMLHAANKAGRFLPDDPVRRTTVMQWFMAAITDAQPASQIIKYLVQVDESPATRAFLEGRLMNILRVFDSRIADREFLAGDISIADLALYPVVSMRCDLLERARTFGNLLSWFDRLGKRPGIARARQVAPQAAALYRRPS
jgi:GST-like protein